MRIRYPRINYDKSKLNYSDRSIILNRRGLTFETYDFGPIAADFPPNFGDSDYEVWLRVRKCFMDVLLLKLIRDKFESCYELQEWLEDNAIPHKIESY